MKYITVSISTGMVGSTIVVDLGYTVKEWAEMNEETQNDIISETVYGICNITVGVTE